jgi:hypothetical protein
MGADVISGYAAAFQARETRLRVGSGEATQERAAAMRATRT